MQEQANTELLTAVQSINKCLPTNKIYLFGSYAYGNPTSESDLDLCILTDKLNERKIETLRKLRFFLSDKVSLPIDILLYTADEFQERAELTSTLEYKIQNEGVLVYGS